MSVVLKEPIYDVDWDCEFACLWWVFSLHSLEEELESGLSLAAGDDDGVSVSMAVVQVESLGDGRKRFLDGLNPDAAASPVVPSPDPASEFQHRLSVGVVVGSVEVGTVAALFDEFCPMRPVLRLGRMRLRHASKLEIAPDIVFITSAIQEGGKTISLHSFPCGVGK